jgi:hypothetical protein
MSPAPSSPAVPSLSRRQQAGLFLTASGWVMLALDAFSPTLQGLPVHLNWPA